MILSWQISHPEDLNHKVFKDFDHQKLLCLVRDAPKPRVRRKDRNTVVTTSSSFQVWSWIFIRFLLGKKTLFASLLLQRYCNCFVADGAASHMWVRQNIYMWIWILCPELRCHSFFLSYLKALNVLSATAVVYVSHSYKTASRARTLGLLLECINS